MAGVTLICLIFFFDGTSWLRRIAYLVLAIILFWGFAVSGTRGALFVLLAGYPAYLFIGRNPLNILRGVLLAAPILALLMFTHIGDSNYQIYRIRSALRPTEDASFLVRLENQQTLRNYLKDKPFGAGIGTSSGAGNRFSPNHFAAQIPTDSWYVQLWIETGVVGLTIYLLMLAGMILLGIYKIWHLNDPGLTTLMIALLAEFIGIAVVSYTNPILGQFPTSTIIFINSILFTTCDRWDTPKRLKPYSMRIGIEAQRLLRPHKHGMDIVALETIRALADHSEHEFVVFVKPDTDHAGLPNTPNVELVELPGGPYPVWEQYALPKAIKAYGLDLLHCTANTAPLHCPVPVVLTLHDIIFLENQPLLRGSWYQRFGNQYRRWNVPRIVTKCDRIITVSDFERQRIIDHLKLDPALVVTIWNAVSQQFRVIQDAQKIADIRLQYKLPDEFIFFLGNTDPKKNVRGVLKALFILKQQGKLTLPVVISNLPAASLHDMLTDMGGQSLTDDIILCGYIPNAVLPTVYNAATIFLCPSLRESFGLPILEAMACGIPVITSSTSSMPEVAGDAALLVDPTSAEAMAAQIDCLIQQPALRHTLRQKGLARAALFSWSAAAAKLLDVYAESIQAGQSLVAS